MKNKVSKEEKQSEAVTILPEVEAGEYSTHAYFSNLFYKSGKGLFFEEGSPFDDAINLQYSQILDEQVDFYRRCYIHFLEGFIHKLIYNPKSINQFELKNNIADLATRMDEASLKDFAEGFDKFDETDNNLRNALKKADLLTRVSEVL